MRWCEFSYCEHSIYIQQHSSSTYIWRIYVSQLTRHSRTPKSYKNFLDKVLLLINAKTTGSMGSYWLRCFHHYLVNPYWIYVSQMNMDITIVTNPSSFQFSWLITELLTKVTRRVISMEQEVLTLLDQLSS